MSKPLRADPKQKSDAAKFHADVFALWGHNCALCGKKNATDAAHALHRSALGNLRFSSPHFARPACRPCHEKVDRYEIEWPLAILKDAVEHHNKIAKVPIPMPTPRVKKTAKR